LKKKGKKKKNFETKNRKPEVEIETEKMIAVNRLCAKTGLMIKPLENRDPHWKKKNKQKQLSTKKLRRLIFI
jgi:phage gp16-like protein